MGFRLSPKEGVGEDHATRDTHEHEIFSEGLSEELSHSPAAEQRLKDPFGNLLPAFHSTAI